MTAAARTSRVAVILPCFNEAMAIERVVREFRAALPGAAIHVFDNNSTDATAACARAAGAQVHPVRLQGKGHVVRRMFADVDAEFYVMADGDGTYHAPSAPAMIALLEAERLDMVNGARVQAEDAAYRRGHVAGNRALSRTVALLFGDRLGDLLSGFRVFSRRFAKSFPASSSGFEIETELTVHALGLQMPVGELPTPYAARMEGSTSKLRTWQDGARIARTILVLLEQERPLAFFSAIALGLFMLALLLALPLLPVWLRTGLVPRLPTALLATALVVLGCLSAACGLILKSVARSRLEARHLAYLAVPGPVSGAAAGETAAETSLAA